MIRQRRLLVHLLSFALLFAQIGLTVHASTHLKADPHATTTSQLCGECLSFAPLQSLAGNAPTVVLAVRIVHDRALNSGGITQAPLRPFNAFRSRAPPILL